MYDMPQTQIQPTSHYEYTIAVEDANAVKNRAFGYMAQLDGWCSNDKAGMLIDLILKGKPEIVLEIGVWGGKSLIPMACALQANNKGIIYGIDPWDQNASTQGVTNEINKGFWGVVNHEAIMWGLVDKIAEFDLGKYIKLLKITSEKAPLIDGIDILHIDGNHTDEASYLDVTKWVPCVKAGGLVIVDDITWSENGIVSSQKRSVDWLNENCIKLAEFSDICEWGVWLKP